MRLKYDEEYVEQEKVGRLNETGNENERIKWLKASKK